MEARVEAGLAEAVVRERVHEVEMTAVHDVLLRDAVALVTEPLPVCHSHRALHLHEEAREDRPALGAQRRLGLDHRAEAIAEERELVAIATVTCTVCLAEHTEIVHRRGGDLARSVEKKRLVRRERKSGQRASKPSQDLGVI